MSSTRPEPSSLASESAILSSLSSLSAEESALDAELSALLAQRAPLDGAQARLRSLGPALSSLHRDASKLRDTVSLTARTAERVGGRVRDLDEQMSRVRQAAERVAQVIELKNSLDALRSSIDGQDWETASRHCARAMAIPNDILTGRFAQLTLATEASPLPPDQTLQQAREELLQAFTSGFATASAARDAAATSRFFKLFPSVGFEAEGLNAYASFVVDLVRVRPPPSAKTSSPLYYIAALTALFESIARIVDQHAPIVDKYYGPGHMTTVVSQLLAEATRVSTGLLENWAEERSMSRKLQDTQSQTSNTTDEDLLVDPREVDKVLTELAGMTGRWALFRRFLHERLSDEDEEAYGAPNNDGIDVAPNKGKASGNGAEKKDVASEPAPPPGFEEVEKSGCKKLFEDILDTYYTPLEAWYTRTIIDKAQRLSSPDTSASHLGSTAPDDVFYILKLVLNRAVGTGSLPVLNRTIVKLKDAVDIGYASAVRRKLDDVYRAAVPVGGARGERAERESRQAFVTLLNDLDLSSQHLERLVKDAQSAPAIEQTFLFSELGPVRTTVGTLNALSAKFKSTLRAGIEQLFAQLVRPRLRTFIPDVYRDVSYVAADTGGRGLDEDGGVVRGRFVRGLDILLDGFRGTLTDANFRLFFGLLLDVLVRPWEKHIMTMRFNELGALRFDRELRAITAHLAAQTAFGDVRDKFARLSQMATVLNLDGEEDAAEFYNGSGIAWKLSAAEAGAVAALRVA